MVTSMPESSTKTGRLLATMGQQTNQTTDPGETTRPKRSPSNRLAVVLICYVLCSVFYTRSLQAHVTLRTD